jgi:hypothetical protein
MGTQVLHMKRGPSLVGSLGSSFRKKRFLSCHDGSSRPNKNYFFFFHTLFHFICPIAQQAGQAVVPRRLYLNMCLWLTGSYMSAPALQKMSILPCEMWPRQNISLLSHQVFPVIDIKGTGHRIESKSDLL